MAFARPLLCEVSAGAIDGLGHVREVLFGVEAVDDLNRIGKVLVGEMFQIQMAPSPSTAWRAARSKPRRVASRSTRAANSLGVASVSLCAALSIAAE